MKHLYSVIGYAFAFLLLVLLSTSCVVQRKVQFDVLTSPVNAFPSDIKSLVLVNHAIKPLNDSSGTQYAYQNKLYYDSVKLDTMLTMLATDALAGIISSGGRYTLMANPVVIPKYAGLDKILSLSSDSILYYLKDSGADAAIILDDVKTFDWLFYYGGNAGPVYITLETYAAAFWKVYRIKTGELLDNFAYMDTLTWTVSDFSFESGFSQIPYRRDALADVAFNAGERYAKRISPYQKTVKRIYFVDSDDRMKEAEILVNQGSWLTAARIWNEVASGKKKKRASMAAFNLALASEIQGNLDIARYWIDKAIELKFDAIYQKYRSILYKRQADVESMKQNSGVW
ncbi:MAG: DUF6340 family protein [Bacteroidales bacterium]|jgi:hypothetical protein|nr:DUF6340 family protein [Bacteroidales bacterium]